MTSLVKISGIFSLIFLLTVGVAHADKPKRISLHGNWSAYTYNEDGGKVCFMASSPIKDEGDYTRRGDIFALITHRTSNNSKDVVSFVAGYPYKVDSDVKVTIDGKKTYTLFTKGDTAWTPKANIDKQLTESIKQGGSMKVVGYSSRGTKTTDTYSLRGSSAAYAAITRACK